MTQNTNIEPIIGTDDDDRLWAPSRPTLWKVWTAMTA